MKRSLEGAPRIAYRDEGVGGRALVLVHGITGSSLDFAHVVPDLARLERCVAYDQRGHGESERLSGAYHFAGLLDDLRRLLDALQLDACDLVGHSMGGMIALRFALQAPDRVSSLVLMSTSARAASPEPVRKRSNLREVVRRTLGRDVHTQMAKNLRATPAEQASFELVIRESFSRLDPRAQTELWAALQVREDLTARLSSLQMPTTVIVGAHDPTFVEASRELGRLIPGADYVEFENASHYPHFEARAGFLAAIRDHLIRAGALGRR